MEWIMSVLEIRVNYSNLVSHTNADKRKKNMSHVSNARNILDWFYVFEVVVGLEIFLKPENLG